MNISALFNAYFRPQTNAIPARVMADGLKLIKKLGYYPEAIVDVGAAHGTPALYRTFPKSKIILVEPLNEYDQSLNKIKNKYKAVKIEKCLLGPKAGKSQMFVHTDHLEGSSVLSEQTKEFNGKSRTVPVATLDQLQKKHRIKSKLLIKIDTQGFELEVLKGGKNSLKICDYVVLETSFFEFYQKQPILSEVVGFMKTKGFEPYDIFDLGVRPLDGAMGQVDIAFVKKKGVFRKSNEFIKAEDWLK